MLDVVYCKISTVSDDIDFIFDDDSFYENDDFDIRRNSKDKVQNNFGLYLIDLCKSFGGHIVNGRLAGDKHGEITCIANEGCSIVDYLIVSSKVFSFISSFEVGDRTESVHFPLQFKVSFRINNDTTKTEEINKVNKISEGYSKYKWCDEKKDTFLNIFSNTFMNLNQQIMYKIDTNIDDAVQAIVNLYQNASESMKIGRNRSHKTKQPFWWDDQCRILKKRKVGVYVFLDKIIL
ncbi:MAG: hypothetical protein AB2705_03135 [Candidatus Thiodiazotropha sp.]